MTRCGLCGCETIFTEEWTKEMALAEMRAKFGDVPEAELAGQCHACHLWTLDVERLARALARFNDEDPDQPCQEIDTNTGAIEEVPIWVAYIAQAMPLSKLPGPETRRKEHA